MIQPHFHFQGIFVPAAIVYQLLAKEINQSDLLFMMLVSGLTEKPGKGCYAERDYFATSLDVSPARISQIVTKLKGLHLLKEYEKKRIRYYEVIWSVSRANSDNSTELARLTQPVSRANSPTIDEEEEMKEMYADRQNGRPVKSAPHLNGDVPPICLQWNDRTYAILRSKKNPAIVMTAISRENGAKYFKELWQRLGENTARIETFLEEYAVKIHRITSPIPSSVRQLCKPEIFNWLERQVLGKSRQVAGSEDNVIN